MESLENLLIKARGDLSLRKAADLIGISHSYLSNLEKGVDPRTGIAFKPSPETLKMISDAYKIDYNKLMQAAGYLPSETDDKLSKLEIFKKDLTKKLKINGLINEDTSKKEIEDLVDKVIKILEISKSN